MSNIGRAGRQARSGGHFLKSGILAQTVGNALLIGISAPIGVGVIRKRAAMVSLVVRPARRQCEVKDILPILACCAEEHQCQPIGRASWANLEFEQKIGWEDAPVPDDHMRAFAEVDSLWNSCRVKGRWRNS